MRLVVLAARARLAALVKERFDGKRLGLTETILMSHTAVAEQAVQQLMPSVLLLAVGHLDGASLSLCRRLGTAVEYLPIVVAAERATEAARIAAWDAGADHVVSPFDLDVIEWCVWALCHRSRVHGAFLGSGLAIAAAGSTAIVSGRQVKLTEREAAVLRVLVHRRNTVVHRGELEHGIWGGTRSRTLDVHIARLRKKLGPVGRRIETVSHVGYRYIEPSMEATCPS